METKSEYDFSMFQREDGKYEFKGKVFNTAKELENHFDEITKMMQKVSNSWWFKILTWRSRRRKRKAKR